MEQKKIKKFEVGKMYLMRSVCDHDCVWMYIVVSRTDSTVVLREMRHGEPSGDDARFRINKRRTAMIGAECVMPTGSYSMAPCLHADNEVPEDMVTYKEMKAKYPDAIVMFRKNDFYYQYHDDAMECAKILGIVRRDLFGVSTTSFPQKDLDVYLPRLVRAGKRIAIMDGE